MVERLVAITFCSGEVHLGLGRALADAAFATNYDLARQITDNRRRHLRQLAQMLATDLTAAAAGWVQRVHELSEGSGRTPVGLPLQQLTPEIDPAHTPRWRVNDRSEG